MAESQQVRGCCPHDCQDSCAWVAHVSGGRVLRVEGAADHPFTRGVLCAKVRDYPKRVYAPDRLLHPLRRIGSKGSGEFERVSWDEALDTVAERFAAIIEERGPEALMPFHYLGSMGVVQHYALMRLFHALGASQIHGEVCGVSGIELDTEGHPVGFDPEDSVHSELIVLWGANVLSTCHHHWHFIAEARKRRGARIISIDPRLTRTARRSDEHIAIKPGSDTVLAAGLARLMIHEKLVDTEIARRSVIDLDDYVAAIEPWTVDRVAEACGVDADPISRLAREIAAARPAQIRLGVGPQQSVAGEALVRGLSGLSLLGDHWRHPGGGLFLYAEPDLASEAAGCPELRSGSPRSLDMADLGSILTDPSLDPAIRGLMIWSSNPAVSQIDAPRVRQGLAREDLFTVVLEHFMTDTARHADIVLPSTTQLEHFDLQGAWGHHYISCNERAIPPLGESRSHGEVMRGLAVRLGLRGTEFVATDEEIAESILPPDIALSDLRKRGWLKRSPSRILDIETKLRLSSGEISPPPTREEGTLQMLTPKSHYFLNSTFANMPRQRQSQGGPCLEMNPKDAAERDLFDGDRVLISSGQAGFAAQLHVTTSIRPGAIVLEGKWWDESADDSAVANLLATPAFSPAGQPAYNEIFVRVTAV
jgi:anaerobic selenocysteine-containing dehydrogenase